MMKRTAPAALSPLTASSPALSIPCHLTDDERHERALQRDRLTFGEDGRTEDEKILALAKLQAAGKLRFLSSAEIYANSPDQDGDDEFDRKLKRENAEWNDRIIAMAKEIRASEALAP